MPTDPWVSVEDVARHLGVSHDTVYRWIEGRALPAHALDYDGLFADWRRVTTAQAEQTSDLAVLRTRLRRTLALP